MIFVDYAICCVENMYLCIVHIQIVVFSGGGKFGAKKQKSLCQQIRMHSSDITQ